MAVKPAAIGPTGPTAAATARGLQLSGATSNDSTRPTQGFRSFMSPVTRGISYGESILYSLHRLIDAAAICLTVGFALRYTGGTRLADVLTIAAATIVVHHIVAELSGVYRSWRGTRLRGELGCVLLTWAYTVPMLLGVGLLTQYNAGFRTSRS